MGTSFFSLKSSPAESVAPALGSPEPLPVQSASVAAIIPIVTGLLPFVKEIVGLIPNSGNKKKLVASMTRSAEASLRQTAAQIQASGSMLTMVAGELRNLAALERPVTPDELRVLALAVELATTADSKDRQSMASAVLAGCDAIDASIDHLVGPEG